MKNFVLPFALICFSLLSAQKTAGDIEVKLTNTLSDEGTIILALHTQESFMVTEGLQQLAVEATTDTLSVVFRDVPPGIYAIAVLHDLNDNKMMDYQANGMPGEPYALSGDSMMMGPPQFSDAKFEHQEEDQVMELRF